jgi:hypothetical protein
MIPVNRLLFSELTGHYPPDLIVLCDFLTFAFSQTRFGITYDMLRELGRPLLSLDSYEWESGDFRIDFFNGAVRQMPDTLRDLDGVLRPCPMNKPAPPEGRMICYSFLHQVRPPAGERQSVREELGIPADAVLFLTAEARWQKMRPKSYGGPFAEIVDRLVEDCIRRLDREVHWIQLGPKQGQGKARHGKVVQHKAASLPEQQFDRLVAAADLLISTNVASTTLIKCIRCGTNALLLHSSVLARGPADLDRCPFRLAESTRTLLADAYPIHPFLMYPMGWYRFLQPVLRDNPYLGTFYQAEILDQEAVVRILEKAAARELPVPVEARARYQMLLQDLPSADACVESFLLAS